MNTTTTPPLNINPPTTQSLNIIAAQLQRIADALQQPAPMQVSEEQALKAWGMRIYETEFLQALERLGIQLT